MDGNHSSGRAYTYVCATAGNISIYFFTKQQQKPSKITAQPAEPPKNKLHETAALQLWLGIPFSMDLQKLAVTS
jgi:hypothetical protein